MPKPRSDMHRTAVEEIRIMAKQLHCFVYESSPQTHDRPNIRMSVGVPDLCVFWAKGQVAYFEVKVGKDKLSDKQADFKNVCLNWGIPYCIVNGGDEFAADILELRLRRLNHVA